MRIKRGLNKKRKHKKVLEQTKGFRLTYSKLYRRAKEALLHSGQYNFEGRKKRAGQFRSIWIQRINAALEPHNMKYSLFISSLKKKNVEIDRKILAGIALDYPETFKSIVDFVK